MKLTKISPEAVKLAASKVVMEGDVRQMIYGSVFENANNQTMSLIYKARKALLQREYEDGRIFIDQAYGVLGEYEQSPVYIPRLGKGIRKHISRLESLLHGSVPDPILDDERRFALANLGPDPNFFGINRFESSPTQPTHITFSDGPISQARSVPVDKPKGKVAPYQGFHRRFLPTDKP